MSDTECQSFNATLVAIAMPDTRRLTLAGLIITPTTLLVLCWVAACAQPGKGCFRFWSRGDRMWAVGAMLLLFVLAALSAYIGLLLTSAELAAMPESELCVQFCEVKWGGVFRKGEPRDTPGVLLPEWGSMISAVFILYCGLHMLLFWLHDSGLLKLIAVLFCVNGLSSFYYHMTALKSWGQADGGSMLLLVWVCVAYMWDEFIETMSQQTLNPEWTFRTRRIMPHFYWRVFARRALSALIWVGSVGFAWWMIFRPAEAFPANGFFSRKNVHAIAIAAPLTFIFVLAIILTCVRPSLQRRRRQELNHTNTTTSNGRRGATQPQGGSSRDVLGAFVEPSVMSAASMRLWVGLVICSLSAGSWIATEQLCDTVQFFRIFPGHVVWHVGMTLGLVNCMVYPALLRADNFRQMPQFVSSPHCLGKLYFAILPALAFLIPEQHLEELGIPLIVENGMGGEGGGESGDDDDDLVMHLGDDPCYSPCACIAWCCCCGCCCGAAGDEREPPSLSAGAVLKRMGSSMGTPADWADWMMNFPWGGGGGGQGASGKERSVSRRGAAGKRAAESTPSRVSTRMGASCGTRPSMDGAGFEFAGGGGGSNANGGGGASSSNGSGASQQWPDTAYFSTKQAGPPVVSVGQAGRTTSSGARALDRARHTTGGPPQSPTQYPQQVQQQMAFSPRGVNGRNSQTYGGLV